MGIDWNEPRSVTAYRLHASANNAAILPIGPPIDWQARATAAEAKVAEQAAELRTLRAERDAAVQAEVAAMNELQGHKDALAQVGEFICRKCGRRQDGPTDNEARF